MENPPNGCHWDNHLSNKAIKFVEMLPDPKIAAMPLMEFRNSLLGAYTAGVEVSTECLLKLI